MTYISHFRATTDFHDTIHGLVRLSVFEREVVDSRQFQRLRNVLQNSVVYMSFPTNKTSRFVHSIGCAHVAGGLFSQGVSKASYQDVTEFLSVQGKFISMILESSDSDLDKAVLGWKKTIRGQSKFTHKPMAKPDSAIENLGDTIDIPPSRPRDKVRKVESLFIVETLWQSVRIAGLVHDIGHLPMSHSFEEGLKIAKEYKCPDGFSEEIKNASVELKQAIENIVKDSDLLQDNKCWKLRKIIGDLFGLTEENEQLKKFLSRTDIHEVRTLEFLSHIINNGKYDYVDADIEAYRRLILTITFCILCAVADKVEDDPDVSSLRIKEDSIRSAFNSMKSLVSGEVEADRMDYTIRDGVASSSTLGYFDIQKVVENTVLTKVDATEQSSDNDENRKVFVFAFRKRALSAIEQFFIERRDGYKYLVFHRTCSRSELSLRYFIAYVYLLAFRFPESILADILRRHGFLQSYSLESGAKTQFAIFDDIKRSSEIFDDIALIGCMRAVFNNAKILLLPLEKRDAGVDVKQFYEKNIDDDSHGKLSIVLMICEQIIFREFKHNYDPLKNETARQRLLRVDHDLTEEQVRQVQKHFLRLAVQEKKIDKFEEHLKSAFNDPHLSIFCNIKPKIYKGFNERDAAVKKIWMISNHGAIAEAEDISATLRNMKKSKNSENTFRLHIIKRNVKFDEVAKAKLNEAVDDVLADVLADFLSGTESIERETSNV